MDTYCCENKMSPSTTSHQSGEVAMASFCRMESLTCRLPSMLSSLEEHDFLFQLQMSDMSQDDSEVKVTKLQSLHGYQWSLTASHEIVPQS